METGINKQNIKICTGNISLCFNREYNSTDKDCIECRRVQNIIEHINNTKYNIGLSMKPLKRTWL